MASTCSFPSSHCFLPLSGITSLFRAEKRWMSFASLVSMSAKPNSQGFFQKTSVLSYDQHQVSQPSLAKMLKDSLHRHGEMDYFIHSDTYLRSTMCQPQGCLLTNLDDLWKLSSV